MNSALTLYCADAAADDRGVLAAPAAVLVRANVWPAADIIASGPLEAIAGTDDARNARRIELNGQILLPAMVNAHTHLDLTVIGPQPFDRAAGFAGWINTIRNSRAIDDATIRQSVRAGVEKSLAGGVVAVGDIVGGRTLAPVEIMRASALRGVSFVECFGFGEAPETTTWLDEIVMSSPPHEGDVRLGLQPHAPYSAGARLIQRCVELHRQTGAPLSAHLAESMAERQCVVRGAGPIRDFLESIGAWRNAANELGRAASPVQHMQEWLEHAPWLLAHVNDCSDDDLDLLASAPVTLAYCPRASAYFEHEQDFGPHRYRDMLARGIRVALGTDSIVCLPQQECDRLSTFDDMRLLRWRDKTDPTLLLRMATTAGAEALGLSPDLFRLTSGPVAGLAAVAAPGDSSRDFLSRALDGDSVPRLLGNGPHSR